MNTSIPSPSALDGVDLAAVHRWLADRREHLVDDLVAYTERETPSDDTALLAAGLAHVEEWLTDRLGPPRSRTQHASADHGDVLVVEHDATADTAGVVTVLAH